jgi:ABC-type branched-subunit amino acid transport system permease subunit
MKKWFSNNLLYIIGALLGAIAGYLYWQQIGCSSGTCAITSKPLNSTLYGAVMGALLLGMFKKQTKKQEEKSGQ